MCFGGWDGRRRKRREGEFDGLGEELKGRSMILSVLSFFDAAQLAEKLKSKSTRLSKPREKEEAKKGEEEDGNTK